MALADTTVTTRTSLLLHDAGQALPDEQTAITLGADKGYDVQELGFRYWRQR
jgi:hypothetical protein